MHGLLYKIQHKSVMSFAEGIVLDFATFIWEKLKTLCSLSVTSKKKSSNQKSLRITGIDHFVFNNLVIDKA